MILILAAVLPVAGAFLIVTLQQNRMLSEPAVETNTKQQSSMSETTGAVIDTVIRENLSRITEAEADATDEMFRDAEIRVQMAGDYTRNLPGNPDSVPRAIRPGKDDRSAEQGNKPESRGNPGRGSGNDGRFRGRRGTV